MSKSTPSIIEVIAAELTNRRVDFDLSDDTIFVNKWQVILEEVPDDYDEPDRTDTLEASSAPEKIQGPGDLLDVCLNALANSPWKDKLCEVTTDGDNKDCEAIFFNIPEDCWNVLKVRR